MLQAYRITPLDPLEECKFPASSPLGGRDFYEGTNRVMLSSISSAIKLHLRYMDVITKHYFEEITGQENVWMQR